MKWFVMMYIMWFVIIMKKYKKYFHIIQLEAYENSGYLFWIKDNKYKIYTPIDIMFVITCIVLANLFLCINSIKFVARYVFFILYLVYGFIILCNKPTIKKPFVRTKRAKRLIIFTYIITVIIFILMYFLMNFILISDYFNIVFAGVISFLLIIPQYVCYVSNFFSCIIENKINRGYYDKAKNKIRNMDKIKSVAITGSYGKTSTKFITKTILGEKYKVLCTPESYNTPMGISKVINNDLTDDYEIFIAELGATKIGDIKEVAELTNPSVGVITSIGPCHLKTFKTIRNIIKTKYELIEFLPNDGIGIFNYDDKNVRRMAKNTSKKKILYALDNNDDVDVWANNIVVNSEGTSFNILTKNNAIRCKTKLLGKHNIYNILAGVCIGLIFDMELEEIVRGIEKIEPIKHRLELICSDNGIIVIDDAYNSNPKGTEAALEVLRLFEGKRKIIVTPGMVELGPIEKLENQKFGIKISRTCDIVILVGKKKTEPIYNAIIDRGFDLNKIHIVERLDEVSNILQKISKVGDIILYENDLPDNYL